MDGMRSNTGIFLNVSDVKNQLIKGNSISFAFLIRQEYGYAQNANTSI